MDSKEKEISQSTLHIIHQNQLKNGKRNDNKQNEIIDIFGGIDDMLSIVLQSNYNLSQIQINNLHNNIINPDKQKQAKIIDKPSEDDEDKGYNKKVTYTFYDEHIIMLKCFNKQNVNKILSMLNSQFIKAVVLLMIITGGILPLLTKYGLSLNVYYIYTSVIYIIIMFYIWLWILYVNKHAIKLLFKQFVFIFKMFYLILFIVTCIWIEYVAHNQPMYYMIAYFMAFGALLVLVMMFDAINVSQTNKILISTFTVGMFSMTTVRLWQYEYYSYEYEMYHKAKITINNHFGFSDIKISLLSIASNSAWILTIFLFQQVILTIFKPTKALVIKCKTFIKYENNKEKTPTTKHLKLWRAVCVGYTLFCLIYDTLNVLLINRMNGTFMFWILAILTSIIFLCLLIINNIKCMQIATIISFVSCISCGLAPLMLGLDSSIITGAFMGFGLFSGYLLKLKQMEQYKQSNDLNISSVKNNRNALDEHKLSNSQETKQQSHIKLKKDENDNTDTNTPNEITMSNVKNDSKWSNIDRTESINSVNLNTAESIAL